jgi:Cytochrome C'
MRRSTIIRISALALLAAVLLTPGHRGEVQAQKTQPRNDALPNRNVPFTPKFEALAETRLLMEGVAHANYRSLQRLLKEKPADAETWTFARGQALLVAETGNLLLLRPPRNNGRDTWMKLAMAMRDEAGQLARKAAARDHNGSKAALVNLTNSCNRCHQTFRVQVRVGPEVEKGEKDAE